MTTDEALTHALRLAVDPPGGVNVDALREIARDDSEEDWDVSTVSRHLRVSPHTLRYYERAGLLAVPRDRSGRRRFDAPTVRRLVFLTRMRASGMPIRALRHYVELIDAGETTIPERIDLLREHRDSLRSQIAQLQLALAAIEYKLAHYQEGPRP